jgi:hypothetical protein
MASIRPFFYALTPAVPGIFTPETPQKPKTGGINRQDC